MGHLNLPRDIPTVVFSVETAARELDSKLVLAASLAQHGCRAIVAHKEAAREIARLSRRIVWQGKSLFSVTSADHLADRLSANDSAIMFMTDEGAMYQADTWERVALQKHWVGHFSGRRLDRMCVWGERQKEVLAPHLLRNAAIAVTGSARFDLCRSEYAWLPDLEEADRPVEPFVLICTRFGAIAHANGLSAPFAARVQRNAWPDSIEPPEIAEIWFKKWRRDVHDFADFTAFVRQLAAAAPGTSIVVRPHPSEDIEFYRRAFADAGNVRINRDGNVLRWIRAASVVVHSGSTSGVEAVLAGRPVVNFLPGEARGDTDIEVANEAGIVVHSIEHAIGATLRLVEAGLSETQWSPRAARMLNNLRAEARPILVAETLSVLRDSHIGSSEVVLPRSSGPREYLRRMIGRLDPYVEGKRGQIDAPYVERILDGCATHGLGRGTLTHATPHYVVVEP